MSCQHVPWCTLSSSTFPFQLKQSRHQTMDHPLDIQEIALQIGSYLSYRALFACVLVSHQWHQAFLSTLWSDASWSRNKTGGRPYSLQIEKHRRLIRYLSTAYIEAEARSRCYQLDYPNLVRLTVAIQSRSLRVSNYSSSKGQNGLSTYSEFIRRHRQTLQELSVYAESPGHAEWSREKPFLELRSIWSLVMATQTVHGSVRHDQQRLRSLTLQGLTINWDEIEACSGLWDILRSLDRMTLSNWSIVRGVVETANRSFSPMVNSNIRHLDIRDGDEQSQHENELILQCSNIESMTLYSKFYSDTGYLFSKMKEGNPWPYLENVHIYHPNLFDKDYANLITFNGRPLRQLTIRGPGFGPLAGEALLESGNSRHQLSLEVLSLAATTDLMGSWAQRVLCSFPKLRIFQWTEIIDNRDIRNDPRPWICNDMRDFCLSLGSESYPEDYFVKIEDAAARCSLMLERLSTLKLLHTMKIGSLRCNKLQEPHAATRAAHFDTAGIMLKWFAPSTDFSETKCSWEID